MLYTGIVDALKIDWSSLMQSVQPKPKVEGSALQRFRPAALFARLGISRKYAGDKLFNEIQEKCQADVTQQEKENKKEGQFVL